MAIGYACILEGVPEIRLKTCTLRYAAEEKLRHLILHNIWALSDMIDYNVKNGIRLFRISSDIIPFGSHPVNKLEWWKDYAELLSGIGARIKSSGIRVSMHPGQYTILNSPNPAVVEHSAEDLHYHARFLDTLGVDCSHKIILHIGGVYGDKAQSTKRYIENFLRLPDMIRCRLVLENDEKCYNIADVMDISGKTGSPAVFDNLHHSLNPPSPGSPGYSALSADISQFRWIELCRSTWKQSDGRQKIHYAQQEPGGKPGAHSSTIDINEFLAFYNSLPNKDIDIMLEVKDKNLSALKCIRTISSHS